ncbi:tetratricopeptide repeat protein [uncultured Treponema sp.]|uniref:tetratricopeptide repeat protein n=1 Tax=uncultured Treponema sp. TaxID=162155 RepID=UPI0025F4E0D2|nr:tetratricopeptide repeat protein [uncultured Treponema sp.]MBQ7538122.1 sel1 repeat family protein [Treponema sp.]
MRKKSFLSKICPKCKGKLAVELLEFDQICYSCYDCGYSFIETNYEPDELNLQAAEDDFWEKLNSIPETRIPAKTKNKNCDDLLNKKENTNFSVTKQQVSTPEPFKNAEISKNHISTENRYEVEAIKGNPEAQLKLAIMFYYGEGEKQDYSKAAYWYEKAAEQGNADAINNLGVLYANGFGVGRNISFAKKLWELASRQGNLNAKLNLQNLYLYGYPKNLVLSKGEKLEKKTETDISISSPKFILHKKNKTTDKTE